MIQAFKLSMKIEDQPLESERENEKLTKKLKWWQSGVFLIYPESRIGLFWGVTKTIIIFISLFTLSFSAAFKFDIVDDKMRNYEIFFDFV